MLRLSSDGGKALNPRAGSESPKQNLGTAPIAATDADSSTLHRQAATW